MKSARVLVMALLSGGTLTSFGADDLYDADYYSKCTLERVKPGMDASAVAVVRQACYRYSIPKRCRDKDHEGGMFSERSICVRACKEASFYERKFGECSLG